MAIFRLAFNYPITGFRSLCGLHVLSSCSGIKTFDHLCKHFSMSNYLLDFLDVPETSKFQLNNSLFWKQICRYIR